MKAKAKPWEGKRPPTEQEKQEAYGCSYCCAVGACPRCHGRAAINSLTAQNAALLAALEFMRANYAQTDYPSDQAARERMDAAIAMVVK